MSPVSAVERNYESLIWSNRQGFFKPAQFLLSWYPSPACMCYLILWAQWTADSGDSALNSNILSLPTIYIVMMFCCFISIVQLKWSKFRTPHGVTSPCLLKYFNFLSWTITNLCCHPFIMEGDFFLSSPEKLLRLLPCWGFFDLMVYMVATWPPGASTFWSRGLSVSIL